MEMIYINILNIVLLIACFIFIYDMINAFLNQYKAFKKLKVGDVVNYYDLPNKYYDLPNKYYPVIITKKTNWKVYYKPAVIPLRESRVREKSDFYMGFILSTDINI